MLLTYLGILLAIGLLLTTGMLSARKSKERNQFCTNGGTAGSWLVCGSIMGTLVGGQTTIGTAQLAFTYGISAWWFALGSSIGCLILALRFAKPIRNSSCCTLLEIIGKEYGSKVELVGSLLSLLSIFISILSQLLAAAALLTSFFPVNFLTGMLIAATLMATYVCFGGLKGAGAGGLIKLMLLYVSCMVGGIAVWGLSHGFSGLLQTIEALLNTHSFYAADSATIHNNYTNIVARGPLKDIGSALSLSLGVLATQTYAQGVWMAKDDRTAIRGTLRCALLIPPIGAASILIGMYMRGHYITAAEFASLQALGAQCPQGVGIIDSAAQAFPMFVIEVLPKWFGGIVLGTLLVTVIGSGSGLTLGASTILSRDIVGNLRRWACRHNTHPILQKPWEQSRWLPQCAIIAILLAGILVAMLLTNGFINDLGFLSLGLRATAVLIPLCGALWFKGKLTATTAMTSMIGATAGMLVAKLTALPGDAMFWGLGIGILLLATNRYFKK